MPYRDLEPISKQLTIVVGLTVVGFMAFGLALSFYRNILFESHLTDIQVQNDELQDQIDEGRDDLEYYRSAQYKDKYAKETLNKINPGEKVLIITEEPLPTDPADPVQEGPSEQQLAAYDELLREMPVYLHWKLFMFERDRIEELKRGL